MTLRELFEIAADAFEERGPEARDGILREAGAAAPWFWLIGPERGRERPPIMIGGVMGRFSMVTFPEIQRAYTTLIANEIVSVQPMSAPSVFYMDYRYGDGDVEP